MSGGNRLYNAALGGCLVACLGLVTAGLKAQQEGPVESTPAVETGAESKPKPAVEHDNSEPAPEKPEAPATEAQPGTRDALETEPQQEPPATESSQDAQREANEIARRDLAAQQSMAESTLSLVETAWLQVIIGFAVLILLGLTVHYTRKAAIFAEGANKAAIDSVEEARRATKEATRTAEATNQMLQMERAWLLYRGIDARPAAHPSDPETRIGFNFRMGFRNHGRSPARNVKIQCRGFVVEPDEKPPEKIIPSPPRDQELVGFVVGPGNVCHGDFTTFSMEQLEMAFNKQKVLVIYGLIVYEDIWGERHESDECIWINVVTSIEYLYNTPIRPDDHFLYGAVGRRSIAT